MLAGNRARLFSRLGEGAQELISRTARAAELIVVNQIKSSVLYSGMTTAVLQFSGIEVTTVRKEILATSV